MTRTMNCHYFGNLLSFLNQNGSSLLPFNPALNLFTSYPPGHVMNEVVLSNIENHLFSKTASDSSTENVSLQIHHKVKLLSVKFL